MGSSDIERGRAPLELQETTSLILTPTAPFHFDGTVFNPSHFPSSDTRWKPGIYWQTMRWKGQVFGIRLGDVGSCTQPRVEMTVFAREALSAHRIKELVDEVRWRLDMDSLGVPKFVCRFKKDRYLGSAILRRLGMRPRSGNSLYEYMVITVMLQNTMVRRSVSMLQALFEQYGELVSFDEQHLWGFWDPESIYRAGEEELRALKLGYRAKTLKRQGEPFVRGDIDELALRQIHNKQVLSRKLDEIYGVGPQSIWYMLFELFHFYDAQEHVSAWEAKVMGRFLFRRDVSPEKVQRFFRERYGIFRQLAFHYLMMDVFWQHREKPIEWLTPLIRL